MNPVVVNGKAVRIKMDPTILARVSESKPDKLKNKPRTTGAKYQFRAILYCLSIYNSYSKYLINFPSSNHFFS